MLQREAIGIGYKARLLFPIVEHFFHIVAVCLHFFIRFLIENCYSILIRFEPSPTRESRPVWLKVFQTFCLNLMRYGSFS